MAEGVEQINERMRDVRIGAALEAAVRDARYGATEDRDDQILSKE